MVPCFPLLGLTPSGLFMGLSSTIIYTSELILCSTNHVKSLTLCVVETQLLFGRDWLHQIQLDWKQVCAISREKPPPETQTELEKLLDEYGEVFQNEIGTLKSTKAKLTLKGNSQPKCYKARPVAYAMKPKVEVELKRLQK